MNDTLQESETFTSKQVFSGASQKTRLRETLRTVALLIESGNQKLWPIFERLEDELLNIERNENRIMKYLKSE